MAPPSPTSPKSEYILLTTFTKDGRPKPTPIWAAPDGDRLLVITEENSWKVKRIRNTPRVTLAACDVRGNPKGECGRGDRRRFSTSRRTAPSTTRSASATDCRQGVQPVQQATGRMKNVGWAFDV